MSKEEAWNNFVPKTEDEATEGSERNEPLDPNDMSASAGKAEEQVWRDGAVRVVEGGEGGKADIFTTMPKTGPSGEIAGPGAYEIEKRGDHGGYIEPDEELSRAVEDDALRKSELEYLKSEYQRAVEDDDMAKRIELRKKIEGLEAKEQ